MKLRDARKAGIKYCENNNCSYACISFDDAYEFTVTDKEYKNTVYFINKNGSLDTYHGSNYARDYHKKHKHKKYGRDKNGKREMFKLFNCTELTEVED